MKQPAPVRLRAWRRGRRGEFLAACWLQLKGYRILARGLRTGAGEIDILARRGRVVAAVEVKARPNLRDATEAIQRRQRARIARAAERFLAGRPDLAGCDIRFDIVLVAPRRFPVHLPDAWRLPGGASE
jgi:putative endonuclease